MIFGAKLQFYPSCLYRGMTGSLGILLYALHSSLMMIEPGAMLLMIKGNSVHAFLLGTGMRNPSPGLGFIAVVIAS